MIRDRWDRLTVLERRLADMDAIGVDEQIVSASPSHYYPWLGGQQADDLARLGNEEIAALVGRAPGRLRGLGLTTLQHPDRAASLLDHAVAGCGLAGVEIPSTAGDVELSDPRLDDLWAHAAELEAVIFLHPFGCTLDGRLDRFYLSNSVGQPVENAVALSHLIFGGVLDRHPGLKVLAAHGGGYLPTFLGRNDHAWRVRPDARTCENLPSSYLQRLWFDSLVHTPGALRSLVDAVGADRVVLGSDYPFDMGVEEPIQALEAARLDTAAMKAVLGNNAARLLGGVGGGARHPTYRTEQDPLSRPAG